MLGGPEYCWRSPNRASSGYGTVRSLLMVSLKVTSLGDDKLPQLQQSQCLCLTPDVYLNHLSYAERVWNPFPAAAQESCLWRQTWAPETSQKLLVFWPASPSLLSRVLKKSESTVCVLSWQTETASRASVAQLHWHRGGNKDCRRPEATRQRGATWERGEGWMEVDEKEPSGVEIIQSTWGVRAGFWFSPFPKDCCCFLCKPWALSSDSAPGHGRVLFTISYPSQLDAELYEVKPDVKLWLRCFFRPDPMQ